MDSGQSKLPCIGTLEASFEGLEGRDAQGFVQVWAIEIQGELGVDSFNVGKVGNVVEGLGGEDSRYADGLQPRGGLHSEFRHSIVELQSQRLEVSRVRCNEVQLLDVVERKLRNVLWILCTSEADGDLGEIWRVEEGDMLERDLVCVPVQGPEVWEEDMVRSEVAEGGPGRESEVVWPGPLDLKVAHNSSISVDTSPFV